MTPRRQAGKTSVQSRMRVAGYRLKEANDAMLSHNYDNTCNRCYYAVFEATHAMLAARGVDEPKSHSGLRIEFDKKIVSGNLFNKDTARFLAVIEDNRNLADYLETDVSKERAESSLSMATEFISAANTSFRLIHRVRTKDQSQDFSITD